MKRIGQWFGLGLANLSSRIGIQMLDFAFHVIELADVGQRLLGNLALVANMQIKELAPRMHQATRLGDAIGKSCFVTAEVVANQRSFPLPKEGSAMLSSSGLTRIVGHDFQICNWLDAQGALTVFAQPPVHDVGVDAELEGDGCNGGARLATFANSLEFELWTVKLPLGDFGASFARHGVHDLHRAHYRPNSACAQDVFAGRIRNYSSPTCKSNALATQFGILQDRLLPHFAMRISHLSCVYRQCINYTWARSRSK